MTDSTIVTESTKRFKWIGTRPIRPDGVPKVTGRAQYGADLKLPGMLYGKVLRSPHAHARILSIDTSAAEAMPGVKAVMTAYNRVDGVWSADSALLADVLRGEWGFEGTVMSDWFGLHSTVEGIRSGLDLEMPGPTLHREIGRAHV